MIARRLLPVMVAGVLIGCAERHMPQAAEKTAPPGSADTASAEAPLTGSTNVIHVVPVTGVGGPLQLVLADAVAASLRDTERPAVLAAQPNDRGPSIVGTVANVRTRGSVVWVTTNWALKAPFGTTVAERTREIVVDKTFWDRNSVEVVNLIVGDAMPAVAAMVQDHVGPLHVAQSVVEAPPTTDIRGIDPTPATPPTPALRPSIPELQATEPPAGPEPAPPSFGNVAERTAANEAADAGGPPDPAPTNQHTAPPVPATPPQAAGPPVILTPNAAPAIPGAAPNRGGLTSDDMAAVPDTGTAPPQLDLPPRSDAPPQTDMLPAQPPKTAMAPAPSGGIAESPGDTPVVWGRPSFLIRPVKGAPGDGNKALNEALRAALHGKDLTVTDDPRQAGYEVVGTVDVGPPVNGRQRARIAWVVKTISGEEVGKAVQENVIAAGSLNRAWGNVASIVTAAAADGIQQLFEAPRPKFTPVGAVPSFPKVPALPRVPGRALPPPPS